MDESISEWGKVFVLGTSTPLPLPTPLLKVFITSQPTHATNPPKEAKAKSANWAQSLALRPFAKPLWQETFAAAGRTTALALNYSHPRLIEHIETETLDAKRHKPVVPVLLLTAVSTFTAWYIYRLTGQKLDLQSQVKSYAETLRQEKQTRASLTAPQIKVFTIEGSTQEAVSAKIFWDTENHSCLIYLNHLPKTAPDQYFQLWFLTKDAQFLKAKSFRPETSTAEIYSQLPPASVGQVEHVVVSQESLGLHNFPEGRILVKGLWR